jgi:cyclopropane fatty-acyl-phospholipid synthase-like methyltransferase
MPASRSTAETIAEDYYDSSDADRFYEKVWGGEDIHIGLYEAGDSIIEASRKTVIAMADRLQGLDAGKRVLDLGAGYGGAARYLAAQFGCAVTCLNLSEVQNARNRLLNRQQGLDQRIEVLHGSFEDIPCEDASVDVIWSQDAFLHSGRKQQVVREIARVLKPGGQLIFTDPMQADDCPDNVLQPVYDRLSLDSLASPGFYRRELEACGFTAVSFADLGHQLRNHYDRVRRQLLARRAELSGEISPAYLDRMIDGLENWVKAADAGYLAWGIMHFDRISGN